MKKIVITIFVLPHELDDLERVLIALNAASKTVGGSEFAFYVTLSLSEELVDWKNSKVSPQFFLDRFLALKPLTEWASKVTFQQRDEILGVVSARRMAHRECSDATHFLWLDPDICFDEHALRSLLLATGAIERDSAVQNYVLSPDLVRCWDGSWDILVNDKYIDQPLGYCFTNNPFHDCGMVGPLEVRIVRNDILGQPVFKFGGGWFTCLSKSLLDRMPLPDSMGHYGHEDDYIMWAMHTLRHQGESVEQFNLHNYVVCENYKFRDRSYLDSLIRRIDRKDEFMRVAGAVLFEELEKFKKPQPS